MPGNILRHATLCFGAVVLAACGGGGGGGDDRGGAQTPALTLEPGSLVAEMDSGVSQPLSVRARPNFTTSSTVYVVVLDKVGVITPNLTLVPQSDGSYLATLQSAPTLANGRHTGALEVHVCPVANCAQEFAGSPVMLPYDFTVGVTPNLVPLSPLAGTGDWLTRQVDATRAGYVAATLDARAFSTRWRWVAPEASATVSPPVIAGGQVFVSVSGYFAPVSKLYALAEFDASVRWEKNFGGVFALNHPAVSDGGAVYVATSGHGDTAMWSFDATNGAQRFRTPFSSQWEHYFAPAIVGGAVYTNGGSYGGMYRFDGATGNQDWFSGTLAQFDEWAPAVDASRAYAVTGGTLHALNVGDGSAAWSKALDNYAFNGYGGRVVPVLAGASIALARSHDPGAFALANSNSLTRVDAATGDKAWTVLGQFVTDPVVANGVLYVANASPLQVEARSLATGAVLWQWSLSDPSETGFIGNLVLTDNLLFLSTNRRTHAIDLATHASVWRYGKPGHKALSRQGVLYIATTDATGAQDRGLTAINLR